MRQRQNTGFTMVELMAVIVVLGVLAAVAAPKFFDYSDDAKEAATKGTLGAVRSAIASFKANESLVNGAARVPSYKEMNKAGVVMDETIPANPYNGHSAIKPVKNKWNQNNPPVFKGNYGWVYDYTKGKFWANTKTKKVNEHKW